MLIWSPGAVFFQFSRRTLNEKPPKLGVEQYNIPSGLSDCYITFHILLRNMHFHCKNAFHASYNL